MPILSGLDLKIFERDHFRESWMCWCHMIVITIDFHKSLPILMTCMVFSMMISIIFKVDFSLKSDIFEIFENISFSSKEQSSPIGEFPRFEMCTRIFRKMRSTYHTPSSIPCPFVQRTSNSFSISFSSEHDGLSVTTDIGEKFDIIFGPYEDSSIMFLSEGFIVTIFRYDASMSDISWSMSKESNELFLKNGSIKISVRCQK